MHRLVFGLSFDELVATILLLGLTLYFLNKKKAGECGNAEDADTGASGSLTVPTETNFFGTSSSPAETKKSASSLLTASTENCYEVFLSFRGPDTRKGFTDHLYHGLLDAGIRAFRDDDKLRDGENIRPGLLEAITNSKILIPILSVNYGTSSWCLDELVQIMECKKNNGQMVLPIFYKVKPAEVEHQIGNFGDVFHKREKRLLKRQFDPAILEKWKQALREVSNLKGYKADGYEAELVKSIVRKALSELKKKFELVISENLVGIDSHVNKVMEFMDNKSDAILSVGIHGMGGIGKTTLAKIIYNKIFDQFEHRSFIADIRESWKRYGVHYLQNQLIYDIMKQEKNEVRNEDEGIKFISSKFKGKKVLVLLDDVDEVVHLKCLAGHRDWFSSGSRIIITTRNKRVLKEVGVDYYYEHREMDHSQSLILFSKHAFRSDSPLKGFEDLTHEVVSITGGLPLSLEVFGSLFCGKESTQWGGWIKKLKKVPHKDVLQRLRISYEALEHNQKQIFLDIACFFIGNTSKIVTSYMWEACGFFPEEGIEVLIFMSLIKVDNDKFRMHDQLRDLGREIVREENWDKPCYRSRIWDYEEVQKVLKKNKGTDKIQGINLCKDNSKDFLLMAMEDGDVYTEKQFENLTNLRFLHLDGAHLSGDFEDSLEELKWLRWPYCPMNFEVKNFHVKELAVLELQGSQINEKWEGWSFFKMAEKLKYLDLSWCESLENMDFLSVFKELEVLILQSCGRLKQIDASIAVAEKLKYLHLSSCEFLENTDFLSAFKKLEVLILYGCRSLKRIDASIGEMKALFRLELSYCKGLTELPEEIGKLKALQQLLLQDTPCLSALPKSIGFLENLEILDISESGIEELPDIGKLRKLRVLRASYCKNLKGIMAESMCDLSFLRCLDFFCCHELRSLPDLPSGLIDLVVTCQSNQLPSLSHLSHLKRLHISGCEFLECILVLPSTLLKNSECSQPMDVEGSESPQSLNTPFKLDFLFVSGCGSIKVVDVSHFIHLRRLYVGFCENLLEVRGNLESLEVINCDSIKQLDLPKFGRLKKLEVSNCKNLAEIEGLDRLGYLESLDISSWTLIRRLDLPKSGRLKKLKSSGNFAEIQGLDRSECLESLDICFCTSIGRLDLPKSERLKELNATYCENLAEIQGLDRLEFLESLNINGCTSIGRLDLPKSERLKSLYVADCKNLAKIEGLDRLGYLERLDIRYCTSIERLDLPTFKRLKELDTKYCKNLAEIQGLDRSEFLERLDIFKCTSIRRLDLPKSGRLKELTARVCTNLVEIQGLNRLEFLERLDISKCTSIGTLDLPKSGRLKILKAKDCANLVEIQGLEILEELNIIGCKSLKTIPELYRTQIYQYYEITNGETTGYGSDDSDEPNDVDESLYRSDDSDEPNDSNEPNDSDESIEWQ